MKPYEIEKKSFKLIEHEAGVHGFPPDQWSIVRRMIHTTADFDYIHTVRFHPEAIQAGIDAIRQGKNIITDTEMAMAGIRKAELEPFGTTVVCWELPALQPLLNMPFPSWKMVFTQLEMPQQPCSGCWS